MGCRFDQKTVFSAPAAGTGRREIVLRSSVRPAALTDQFLRSLCYALQQAAGVDGELPEILENRLVPSSPSPCSGRRKRRIAASRCRTPSVHRFGIRLSGGTSFGSGLHPSTRLAVQTLESLLTGSGAVLSNRSLMSAAAPASSPWSALGLEPTGYWRLTATHRPWRRPVGTWRPTDCEHKVRVESTAVQDIASAWQLVVANLAVSVLHVLLDGSGQVGWTAGFSGAGRISEGAGRENSGPGREKGDGTAGGKGNGGWRSFLLQKGSSNRWRKAVQTV